MNNNPITEVGMFVIASLLIIGGAMLLYFGRIDFTAATLMFGTAAGILGVQGAFKAPSPAQQTQLNGQQQNLQYLLSQTLATLPSIVQAVQPQSVPAQLPTIAPQPQNSVSQVPQVQSQVNAPARVPVANSGAMQNQQPLQGSQQQQGQFLPAVNLGQETETAIQQPQIAFPQRSWNDSQIMRSVGPRQGQGQ